MGTEVLKRDEKHHHLADKMQEVERRSRILNLIRNGATAERVAEVISKGDPANGIEPHYISPQGVSSLVKRYLDKVHTEDSLTLEQLRVLENERLDALWLSLQQQLRNADGSLNMKVVDRLTRLSERRSKMNGLDAAQKHEVFLGNPLAALGIEKEHLERGQQAFIDSFAGEADPGDVVDAEVVEE